MSNINVVSHDICTGCSACQNICSVDAIQMKPDEEGFIMPVSDANKCINCGACEQQCPILHFTHENESVSVSYAVMASDDIRAVSSSGGMITLLAEETLKKGGCVCGAAYGENLSVNHVIVYSANEMHRIRGSKFVQSNIGMVYREIKNILDTGKYVLFTGTPCQIAGLYNYLNKDYDNLLTVDILCHGVPSPKVFDKYLNETFADNRTNIERFDFRDKKVYGWLDSINAYFKNGEEFHRYCKDDPYYKVFLPCVSLRRSCGVCKFSSIPRVADISVGDFWGIEKYDPTLNDKKGTSLVLVNSPKGKAIFEAIKPRTQRCEEVPIKYALPDNGTLVHPFRLHSGRSRFFRDLDLQPLSRLSDKATTHHYDIGIVGLWYGLNYGSILTYYALYKVVNSMGFDAIMVNKPNELWQPRYTDRNSIANRFIYKYCNVSNIRGTLNDWCEMNDHCDSFIVGSDVVWNYNICGHESKQFFFLDFVDDDKKKIAMASSFGASYDAPESERIVSRHYLNKFDYIGVREDEAVEICLNQFGVRAVKVMDPVFLCDKRIYHRIADSSYAKKPEKYIATYILGPSDLKGRLLIHISEKLEMPLINSPNPNVPVQRFVDRTGLPALPHPSVEDWLFYIKNADFYVGDSFHGLCFALIFEKPFVILLDRNISGLCRFTNLLKTVGLENRLIFTDDSDLGRVERLLTQTIDYEWVRGILKERSEESYNWLKNAISGVKTKTYEAYDILLSRMKRTVNHLNREIERLKAEKHATV